MDSREREIIRDALGVPEAIPLKLCPEITGEVEGLIKSELNGIFYTIPDRFLIAPKPVNIELSLEAWEYSPKEARRCYNNSFSTWASFPDTLYTEGVLVTEGLEDVVPIEHGWLQTADGQVVETTLPMEHDFFRHAQDHTYFPAYSVDMLLFLDLAVLTGGGFPTMAYSTSLVTRAWAALAYLSAHAYIFGAVFKNQIDQFNNLINIINNGEKTR